MNLTQKRTLARQLTDLAARIPTDPQAAIETLLTLAADLDPARASSPNIPPGNTVPLKYAWKTLARESWMPAARTPIVPLAYQGQPIAAISDKLEFITLKTGAKLPATPDTRLERK